jgi:hypothetical protein
VGQGLVLPVAPGAQKKTVRKASAERRPSSIPPSCPTILAHSFPLTSGDPNFIPQIFQISPLGGILYDTLKFDNASFAEFQATVPEPSPRAMLLAGFVGPGFVGCSVKARSAAVA